MELKEKEFSLKRLFIPLTNLKAIHFIIAIGIVVFFNMLFNHFVWDDYNFIISDPGIHKFDIIRLFSNTNNFNNSGFYRPVLAIYYSLLFNLFGKQPFYYHAIQLILHITNTCILFLLFKQFFNKIPSFILSLLFLIHPLQVESVTYIAATQSELFFLFGIVALFVSLKEKVCVKHIILISILSLLSLLIYEASILFLINIVFYQLLYNRNKKILFLSVVPAIIGCYILIRFLIFHISGSSNLSLLTHFSLTQRAAHIPGIVFYYLKILVFPSQLAIDRLWVIEKINLQNFYIPLCIDLIFFASIMLLGKYLYKNNKKLFKVFLFFLLWFLLGLGILIQIYPLDMTVADRWFYFPIAGLLGMIGTLIKSIHFPYIRYKTISYACIICILTILSIRTIIRNINWHDPITLYSHDVQIESNFDIEYNLGANLANAGRFREALPHIQKSLELFPRDITLYHLEFLYEHEYLPNLYYMGFLYDQVGDYRNAIIYYNKAISEKKLDQKFKNEATKRLSRIQAMQKESETMNSTSERKTVENQIYSD